MIILDWNEYYEGEAINISLGNDRHDISKYGQAWVNNCQFRNIENSNGNGGVLYYSGSISSQLLVKLSVFSNCSCADSFNGGAIYILLLKENAQ